MFQHNTLAGVLVRRLDSWSIGLWFESLCCPPSFKEYFNMLFKVVRKNISQKINQNINRCHMRVPVPSCSRSMISGQNLTGAGATAPIAVGTECLQSTLTATTNCSSHSSTALYETCVAGQRNRDHQCDIRVPTRWRLSLLLQWWPRRCVTAQLHRVRNVWRMSRRKGYPQDGGRGKKADALHLGVISWVTNNSSSIEMFYPSLLSDFC